MEHSNLSSKMQSPDKNLQYICKTYTTSQHLNLLCNIHVKYGSEISKTLKTYACNMQQTFLPAPTGDRAVKLLRLAFYLCADLSRLQSISHAVAVATAAAGCGHTELATVDLTLWHCSRTRLFSLWTRRVNVASHVRLISRLPYLITV
jgi:hypothetical protein